MSRNEDDEIIKLLRRISDSSDVMQENIVSLDKKVDLHIQRTEYELKRINELDEHQNRLLDQHIEGVNTLKKWCDQHEQANRERFEMLEEPAKWIKTTVKIAMALGGLATAILTVGKLLKWF